MDNTIENSVIELHGIAFTFLNQSGAKKFHKLI